MSKENKAFITEYMADKYKGPLKAELAPWSRGSWEPWTRRCGEQGILGTLDQ